MFTPAAPMEERSPVRVGSGAVNDPTSYRTNRTLRTPVLFRSTAV